jgi:hypothetical protein
MSAVWDEICMSFIVTDKNPKPESNHKLLLIPITIADYQ